MTEHIVDALVLDRTPVRELDESFFLFSRESGVFEARAVSSRKPASKFSPNLDVLSFATLRLVGEDSFVITDAVAKERFPALRKNPKEFLRAFRIAAFVRETFVRNAPEARIWEFLLENFSRGSADIFGLLSLLGYDARHASCAKCRQTPVTVFLIDDHSFRCAGCVSKIPESRLLYRDR